MPFSFHRQEPVWHTWTEHLWGRQWIPLPSGSGWTWFIVSSLSQALTLLSPCYDLHLLEKACWEKMKPSQFMHWIGLVFMHWLYKWKLSSDTFIPPCVLGLWNYFQNGNSYPVGAHRWPQGLMQMKDCSGYSPREAPGPQWQGLDKITKLV